MGLHVVSGFLYGFFLHCLFVSVLYLSLSFPLSLSYPPFPPGLEMWLYYQASVSRDQPVPFSQSWPVQTG